MRSKILYRIELKDGSVFEGTAKEVVTALRKSSRMEYDMSNLRFKARFSRRHKIQYGKRLHVLVDRDFVQDLGSSPASVKFMWVRCYQYS
jgi:hypothetical protein